MSEKKTTAILVAVQLPGVSDDEHQSSLDELERLVTTLGFQVAGRFSQKRKTPAPGTVLGEGKLEELAQYTDETSDAPFHANIVVIDSDISPTQLQHLEDATNAEVLDRTGVILEIFNRHAKSREARLQVEIAKLNYLAPRLRTSRVGGDRQGGGIGAKGAGETAHELDKRRIRDRVAELRAQLEVIRVEQENRRARRQEANSVALIGYTNAGKSSLMRALTDSEVLVADKLFATLDTTVRALQPETTPRILVSDTVGFIKKLPHDLVASFRSTLDEALAASLLLFTVDASDPTFRSQLEVTKQVTSEIGADDIPNYLVLNKIDRLNAVQIKELQEEFPQGIFISTRDPADVARVRQTIISFFEKEMADETFVFSYAEGHLLSRVRELGRVIEESHNEHGTSLTIRAKPEDMEKARKIKRKN